MTLNSYVNIFPKPSLPQKIFTADQVRNAEPRAAEQSQVAMYTLMERAGASVAQLVLQQYASASSAIIFAGHGNNGGDAYVVASILGQRGWRVALCELGNVEKLSNDAQQARNLWLASSSSQIQAGKIAYSEYDVCIDGLLGTGISGDVREPFASVIRDINNSNLPTVSIDIPSGLCSDSGAVCGVAVNADHTVTFVGIKSGLVTGIGKQYTGQLHFTDLGVGDAFQRIAKPLGELVSFNRLRPLPERPAAAHKGDFGKLLCIGGNVGFAGAIRLNGEAAMRTGAGLVKLFCHEQNTSSISCGRPELMIESRLSEFDALLSWCSAIVIGSGLARDRWAREIFKRTLEHCAQFHKPLVIDADGLNLLAENSKFIVPKNTAILTPHPGEASRLLGVSIAKVEADRYGAAQAIARKHDAVTVLKGAGSIIASPEAVWVCEDGNPGMATAGMGDVLSGILGSLLAQKMGGRLSAIFGVCLHSHCADVASGESGARGMLASDLFPYIRNSVNR